MFAAMLLSATVGTAHAQYSTYFYYRNPRTGQTYTIGGTYGSGWLQASYAKPFAPSEFVFVERCDACEKFATDLAAAQSFGGEVRLIPDPETPGYYRVAAHYQHLLAPSEN
jgi:hypothetical protein